MEKSDISPRRSRYIRGLHGDDQDTNHRHQAPATKKKLFSEKKTIQSDLLMAESKENESIIHDQHLKVPDITSIVSDKDSLLITFVFIQKSVQSIDNADDHGGHAHKHGDEVFTIQKELQFHEIETEIKCNDDDDDYQWISLGGFRTIEILQRPHSHSKDDCKNHSHHHHPQIPDDTIITLCYPTSEITHHLASHQLEWNEHCKKAQIRMRYKYKIAYRVAHLSQQVDNIISAYSKTKSIVPSDDGNKHKEPKKNKQMTNFMNSLQLFKQNIGVYETCQIIQNILCLSLCTNKSIQMDNLSTKCKKRAHLSSTYPNDWLFFPSLTCGSVSENMLSQFDAINMGNNQKINDLHQRESVLFTFDGYNQDNETLCCCYAVSLNHSIWHRLPSLNNSRSRAQLVYAPNSEQLIVFGGYQYDAKNGTNYLDSMEYLSLNHNISKKQSKMEWKIGSKMRTKRCEHSVGLISNKNAMKNQDIMLVAGGSSKTYLRSCSILTVTRNNEDDVVAKYKRGGLMKEACIKGSICHDVVNNNGDNVYIVGGNNGFGSTRNTQCFNLEKNRWNMIKGTLYEHDDYPCVWMEENQSCRYFGMIGVIGHSQQLSCVEYYDHKSNEWISHCQYPQFEQQISRMVLWKKLS